MDKSKTGKEFPGKGRHQGTRPGTWRKDTRLSAGRANTLYYSGPVFEGLRESMARSYYGTPKIAVRTLHNIAPLLNSAAEGQVAKQHAK